MKGDQRRGKGWRARGAEQGLVMEDVAAGRRCLPGLLALRDVVGLALEDALRLHDPDSVEGAAAAALGPDGIIAGLRQLRDAGVTQPLLAGRRIGHGRLPGQGPRGLESIWPVFSVAAVC